MGLSLKTWMTTCLVAALLGVSLGAAYVAATGHFDAPDSSSTATLPAPTEQAAPAAPIAGLAAAKPRAVSPAAAAPRKASPPTKAKAAKPPKVKHKASDSGQKSTKKSAGKAKTGK